MSHFETFPVDDTLCNNALFTQLQGSAA